MDIESLDKGDDYSELKESYVIFLCPFDLFGKGQVVYTFANTCVENREIELLDKTYKVFYNLTRYELAARDDTRRLLKYLVSGESSDFFTQRIDERVARAKGNQTWRREYMTLEQELKHVAFMAAKEQRQKDEAKIKQHEAEIARLKAEIEALKQAKLTTPPQAGY